MIKLILKVIILIILVEGYSRLNQNTSYSWYNCLDQIEDPRLLNIKYIFIGSSRVDASIVPNVFHSNMDADVTQVQVLNLGKGNTTLPEHYFGIKKLIDIMPNQLKDVVVFAEATEVFPSLNTWNVNWVLNNRIDLLARVLNYDDMTRFWIESTDDIESKLAVVFEKISCSYKARGSGIPLLAKYENILKINGVLPTENTGNLIQGEGIKTKIHDLKRAHDYAIYEANSQIANQKLDKQYDKEKYILYCLNKLIRDNGGRLIIFDLPLCSVQQKEFTTVIAQQNMAYVKKCLKLWDIAQIEPKINTTDDDFPDLWHLRRSRAAEFTTTVADTYKNLLLIEKKKGI